MIVKTFRLYVRKTFQDHGEWRRSAPQAPRIARSDSFREPIVASTADGS
jgi:hypothetical protein